MGDEVDTVVADDSINGDVGVVWVGTVYLGVVYGAVYDEVCVVTGEGTVVPDSAEPGSVIYSSGTEVTTVPSAEPSVVSSLLSETELPEVFAELSVRLPSEIPVSSLSDIYVPVSSLFTVTIAGTVTF